jgi:CRP-like cAMP-binding protein
MANIWHNKFMVDSNGSPQELTKDLQPSATRRYKTGQIILFQGEIPPLAFVITTGFVTSYSIRSSGDEQIIAIYSAGDIVPIEWLFKRSPVALYYYRAFTNCELRGVYRDDLLLEIKRNKALANSLLNRFASSFIGATVHIHAIGHSHAQEKFIKLLHYLVLRFGLTQSETSGLYTIPFKLTHAQIASMIGITRESVSIEATKMKKRGSFTVSKGIYTINLPVLIQSLGSEEFDSLEIKSSP